MQPPATPDPVWAPPEVPAPSPSQEFPRRRRARRWFWGQAAATLLLVSVGNVEGPPWHDHPAAPLAWGLVLMATLTAPLVPLAWLSVVARAGAERGPVATYAVAGLMVWLGQLAALLPYVQ